MHRQKELFSDEEYSQPEPSDAVLPSFYLVEFVFEPRVQSGSE